MKLSDALFEDYDIINESNPSLNTTWIQAAVREQEDIIRRHDAEESKRVDAQRKKEASAQKKADIEDAKHQRALIALERAERALARDIENDEDRRLKRENRAERDRIKQEQKKQKEQEIERKKQAAIEEEKSKNDARLKRKKLEEEKVEIRSMNISNLAALLPKNYLLIDDERLKVFSRNYLHKFVEEKRRIPFTKKSKLINIMIKNDVKIINQKKFIKHLRSVSKDFRHQYNTIITSSADTKKEYDAFKEKFRKDKVGSKLGTVAGLTAITAASVFTGSWIVFLLGMPPAVVGGSNLMGLIKSNHGKDLATSFYLSLRHYDILKILIKIASGIKGIPESTNIYENTSLAAGGYIKYPMKKVEKELSLLKKMSFDSVKTDSAKMDSVRRLLKGFFKQTFQIDLFDSVYTDKYYNDQEEKRLETIKTSIESVNPRDYLDKIYFDGGSEGINSNENSQMNAYLYKFDEKLYKSLTFKLLNTDSSTIKNILDLLNSDETNNYKVNMLIFNYKIEASSSTEKQAKENKLKVVKSEKIKLNKKVVSSITSYVETELQKAMSSYSLKTISTGSTSIDVSDDKTCFRALDNYFIENEDIDSIVPNVDYFEDSKRVKEYDLVDNIKVTKKDEINYLNYILKSTVIFEHIDKQIDKEENKVGDNKEKVEALNDLKRYVYCIMLSMFKLKDKEKLSALENNMRISYFKNASVIEKLCFDSENEFSVRSVYKSLNEVFIYTQGIKVIID